MSQSNPNIAALIGSRICHDLISPVGAVVNGLELVAMSASARAPEFELVSESAENAAARIRLFRLAFGSATAGQIVRDEDLRDILNKVYAGSRLSVQWQATGGQDRLLAKAALLAVLCMETALPRDGRIIVMQTDRRWSVLGDGEKLSLAPEFWDALVDGNLPDTLPPAAVQFALLGPVLAEAGRRAEVQRAEGRVAILF